MGWHASDTAIQRMTRMATSRVQRQTFEDRIARINKGAANTMGEVHIGPRDEAMARTGKPTNTVRVKKKRKQKVEVGRGSNVAIIPIAILTGARSAFAGKAASYHFFEEGGLMPIVLPATMLDPYLPFAHLFIAGVLAMMFVWTFRLTGFVRKAAVILGIAGILYAEPRLVETFPGVYASMFSEAYVAEQLSGAA